MGIGCNAGLFCALVAGAVGLGEGVGLAAAGVGVGEGAAFIDAAGLAGGTGARLFAAGAAPAAACVAVPALLLLPPAARCFCCFWCSGCGARVTWSTQVMKGSPMLPGITNRGPSSRLGSTRLNPLPATKNNGSLVAGAARLLLTRPTGAFSRTTRGRPPAKAALSLLLGGGLRVALCAPPFLMLLLLLPVVVVCLQ